MKDDYPGKRSKSDAARSSSASVSVSKGGGVGVGGRSSLLGPADVDESLATQMAQEQEAMRLAAILKPSSDTLDLVDHNLSDVLGGGAVSPSSSSSGGGLAIAGDLEFSGSNSSSHLFSSIFPTVALKGKAKHSISSRTIAGFASAEKSSSSSSSSSSSNNISASAPRLKSSKFRGVHWDKSAGKWHVQICIQSRIRHLGHFDLADEIKAAKAYDAAVIENGLESSKLNFPEDHSPDSFLEVGDSRKLRYLQHQRDRELLKQHHLQQQQQLIALQQMQTNTSLHHGGYELISSSLNELFKMGSSNSHNLFGANPSTLLPSVLGGGGLGLGLEGLYAQSLHNPLPTAIIVAKSQTSAPATAAPKRDLGFSIGFFKDQLEAASYARDLSGSSSSGLSSGMPNSLSSHSPSAFSSSQALLAPPPPPLPPPVLPATMSTSRSRAAPRHGTSERYEGNDDCSNASALLLGMMHSNR